MRRQSKIEDALNKLFKKPDDTPSSPNPDALSPLPEKLPEPGKNRAKESKRAAQSKTPKKPVGSSPLRVDPVSTTFTLDLNEILVSPPFEELAPEPMQQSAAPAVQLIEVLEGIEQWYDHQIVICSINEQKYAVRIDLVEGIVKMQPITALPLPRPFIAGIINLRGGVLPIINLRQVLGLKSTLSKEQNKHILLVNANNYKAGLIVDQVNAVLTPPNTAFEILPSVSGENPHVVGVVRHQDQLILMLDLKRILSQMA